jgi:Family of unknown function (DUF6166)
MMHQFYNTRYVGLRLDPTATKVTADDVPLPLRLDLRSHSPAGFNWGYSGSGPAQLALALLAHAVGEDLARCLYQTFKNDVVAGWGRHNWVCFKGQILEWCVVQIADPVRQHADRLVEFLTERRAEDVLEE